MGYSAVNHEDNGLASHHFLIITALQLKIGLTVSMLLGSQDEEFSTPLNNIMQKRSVCVERYEISAEG